MTVVVIRKKHTYKLNLEFEKMQVKLNKKFQIQKKIENKFLFTCMYMVSCCCCTACKCYTVIQAVLQCCANNIVEVLLEKT